MAESIIIHFSSAAWDELVPWIEQRAISTSGRRYHYPDPNYVLLLYEYRDHRGEFEPEDLDRLCARLGGFPSSALCLEMRGSRSKEACEAAAELSVALLRLFDGLADDTLGNGYWSLDEIESGSVRPNGRYLDPYRVGWMSLGDSG